MDHRITWNSLPKNLAELKALPEADLKTPEGTAALAIAALCVYPQDKEECYRMLDFLRGPRPMSPMDKQFIRDRFMDGKDYIPRSYFKGATPQNNYTPDQPYVIELKDSAAPMADQGYKILLAHSGGADSDRSITLRNKPSTGEWFLWDQMLLAGIRIPVSQDDWA
ncbi:MAG: hypothetical protein IJ147_11700 [Lachnospiraceae bacterium]|nr:hypothetical protein [Lachnospiraceae bacterium]MBQ8118704.1 hypothetical protein [Lachnospiraceae bacterium]